jgi:hypothetical protein
MAKPEADHQQATASTNESHARHTPWTIEPWWAHDADGHPFQAGWWIADADGVQVADRIIDYAQAVTIAAAPDLLAALKTMVALYDGVRDCVSPGVLQKLAAADVALLKAEAQ